MCSSGKIKSFIIKNPLIFKFIRFVSTGSRCGFGDSWFNVLVIEFFGTINPFDSTDNLIINYIKPLWFLLLLLILL